MINVTSREVLFVAYLCETGVVSAKVKQSGQSKGYDFIEFVNRAAAERHLQAYNGTLMPNVEQLFRLNWASFGAGERKQDDIPDYTMTHPITLYLWGIWQLMLRAIPC
ncbi:putative RNA recognition motif domain, nucleotide-binding alpha-beta plait domain superfamily [Helianthus annuus]|nr:putative RNA recognition motif domain, nucleotide-binding alpha-beta plait domain superfamily [Helianthus annuus]